MKTSRYQNGYTATAMIAMLAIGGIVTIGSARHTMSTVSESQGQAYGSALANVNRAVGTYTVLYYKQLLEGQAIPNVAIPTQPTVQELGTLGLLNAEFNPTPPLGGAYAILISREPAGCVAPNCNLTSRAWYTRPITNPETGNVDIEKLAAAAQALQGDGGWSAPDEPGLVRGTGGWSRSNPAGNSPGILMAINGYGSSVFANYVDRTGVQGMLADLKMGGYSINGIHTVNAQNVALPNGRSLKIGSTSFFGDGSNTAIYQDGSLFIEHPDFSAADIGRVRNVSSEGTVTSRRMVANGNGTVGYADRSEYDISAGTIGAGRSIYSYNVICAGNTQAECGGSGGSMMRADGDVIASRNLHSGAEVYASGWYRSVGDGGWYSERWGGGLYMNDPSWIRTWGDKGMYTGGQMQAGSLQSNSTLSVAGNATVGSQTVVGSQVVGGNHTVYGSASVTNALTPGMIAWEGGYCGGNAGAIGRDANNNLFICN